MTTTKTCDRMWCRGYDGDYDCGAAGRHSWRPWRYDADGLYLEVDAIAFTSVEGCPDEPIELLLTVANTEDHEKVTQNVSVSELDGIVDLLTRARSDLVRALTSS